MKCRKHSTIVVFMVVASLIGAIAGCNKSDPPATAGVQPASTDTTESQPPPPPPAGVPPPPPPPSSGENGAPTGEPSDGNATAELENIVNDYVASYERAVESLTTVRDEASAQAAIATFQECAREVNALVARRDELGDLPESDVRAVAQRVAPKFAAAWNASNAQDQRFARESPELANSMIDARSEFGQAAQALFRREGKLVIGIWMTEANRLSAIPASDSGTLYSYKTNEDRVCFSPDGMLMFTSASDPRKLDTCNEAIWNLATGEKLAEWVAQYDPAFLAFSPDGKVIACLGKSLTSPSPGSVVAGGAVMRVIDVASGELRSTPGIDETTDPVALGFTDIRTTYVVQHSQAGAYFMEIDVESGQVTKQVIPGQSPKKLRILRRDGSVVGLVREGREANLVLFKSIDDALKGGEPARQFGTFRYSATIACSDDERWVAVQHATVVDNVPQGKFAFYDLSTTETVHIYDFRAVPATELFLSPDGAYLAAHDDGLCVYDRAKNTAQTHDIKLIPVGFTRGGALAVRSYGQPFQFLDPATLQPLSTPLEEKWIEPLVETSTSGNTASTGEDAPSTADPTPDKFRTWTSADGKFSVEAELVKVIGNVVHLKRKTGGDIQVPLDKLSDDDVKFVKGLR